MKHKVGGRGAGYELGGLNKELTLISVGFGTFLQDKGWLRMWAGREGIKKRSDINRKGKVLKEGKY